jgi:hypothetical protein
VTTAYLRCYERIEKTLKLRDLNSNIKFGWHSLNWCSATFSPAAHPNLSDTWWHTTTKFRLTKGRYETIHGHRYASTYIYLPCNTAGIWEKKHNTYRTKLPTMNQCVCVCVCVCITDIKHCLFLSITWEYRVSYTNVRHTWKLMAAHRLRDCAKLRSTYFLPTDISQCRLWMLHGDNSIVGKKITSQNMTTRISDLLTRNRVQNIPATN